MVGNSESMTMGTLQLDKAFIEYRREHLSVDGLCSLKASVEEVVAFDTP